mgnify:CR=1 FL=1
METKTNKLTTPFRFRDINSQTLLTNEVGDYGFFRQDIIHKIFANQLTKEEEIRLDGLSIDFDGNKSWKLLSLARRAKSKLNLTNQKLAYIMVVPTLRCDLSCVYCQVSRAPVTAQGFDWDKDTLKHFGKYLDNLETQKIQIEFQGGEVTLRPDIIKEIIEICESKFSEAQFVICTNLLTINKEIEFSEKGTRELANLILRQNSIGKLFIEPHLKSRLNLTNGKVKCKQVLLKPRNPVLRR